MIAFDEKKADAPAADLRSFAPTRHTHPKA